MLNRLLIEAAYSDFITNKVGWKEIRNFSIVFRFVTFESDTFFIRTKFYGNTAFESVNFKREANLTNAEFKRTWDRQKFSLSYLNFKNLIINFDQLPKQENRVHDSDDRIKSFADREEKTEKELQPLSQVSAGLEAIFRKENRLDDRNKAYYHMKTAELEEKTNEISFKITEQSLEKMKSEEVPGNVLEKLESIKNKEFKGKEEFLNVLKTTIGYAQTDRNESLFLKPAKQVKKNWGLNTKERWEWILWGWSSGYGTKIWWVVGWYAGFLVIFTAIYWKWGILYRAKTNEDSSFRLRLVVFPWQYFTPASARHAYSSTSKIIDAIRFSKELILKLGYRNTTISGSKLLKAVVVIEWALGFYLLALLGVTLANTFPLLNRLISGVF